MRDPSSGMIAFLLPIVLLLIFGYGINLDTTRIRLGVLNEDGGAASQEFVQQLKGSPYLVVTESGHRAALDRLLQDGEIRGYTALEADFSRKTDDPSGTAPLQVITDGTEPNTANFVSAYVTSIWQQWQAAEARDQGRAASQPLDVQTRYWFNPAAESRHYLIPGSITVIMTVIGALLTSLVVAREWERGTWRHCYLLP